MILLPDHWNKPGVMAETYGRRAAQARGAQRRKMLAFARAAGKIDAMSSAERRAALAASPPPTDWDLPYETVIAMVMSFPLEAVQYIRILLWLVSRRRRGAKR